MKKIRVDVKKSGIFGCGGSVAFSVPETILGDASTDLTRAISWIVCEALFVSLGRLARFIGRAWGGDGGVLVTAA